MSDASVIHGQKNGLTATCSPRSVEFIDASEENSRHPKAVGSCVMHLLWQ